MAYVKVSNPANTYNAEGTQIASEGLQSALKQLAEEIHESATVSENLVSSLGIGGPEKEGAEALTPCGHIYLVRQLTQILRAANAKLGQSLQHLNS